MSNTTLLEQKLRKICDLAQEIIQLTADDKGETYEDAMRIWRRVQGQLEEDEE